MNIQTCTNGDLEISLTKREIKLIKTWNAAHSIATEFRFIATFFVPMGYKQIAPEKVGALTDAPLITDGKNVWGYMDYQITSFIEKLLDGKMITWQKG